MALDIPIRGIERLPNAVQIGLTVRRAGMPYTPWRDQPPSDSWLPVRW
jgi:hypothetical protein